MLANVQTMDVVYVNIWAVVISLVNLLILFLNCEGEQPYCFLKQRLNEVRLLKPQAIAISLI